MDPTTVDWTQYTGTGDTTGIFTGDSSSVGPQPDGTYNYPDAAQPNNQPWDTSGGANGAYNSQVLDVLKYGVGVWQQDQSRKDFYDYKRFEATNGGLFQQGSFAGGLRAMPARNRSLTLAAMVLLGVVVFHMLEH
jgi:hypothetical protein